MRQGSVLQEAAPPRAEAVRRCVYLSAQGSSRDGAGITLIILGKSENKNQSGVYQSLGFELKDYSPGYCFIPGNYTATVYIKKKIHLKERKQRTKYSRILKEHKQLKSNGITFICQI